MSMLYFTNGVPASDRALLAPDPLGGRPRFPCHRVQTIIAARLSSHRLVRLPLNRRAQVVLDLLKGQVDDQPGVGAGQSVDGRAPLRVCPHRPRSVPILPTAAHAATVFRAIYGSAGASPASPSRSAPLRLMRRHVFLPPHSCNRNSLRIASSRPAPLPSDASSARALIGPCSIWF